MTAIPASSKLVFGIRAPSAQELATIIPRVLACFSAAALATGCTFTVKREILYLDLRPSQGLADAFMNFAKKEWGAEGYEVPDGSLSGGSTDFVRSSRLHNVKTPLTLCLLQGNVSYHLPSLHPMFMLPELASWASPS